MIDVNHVVLYGAILSVIASSIILISLYVNPRMWLQDFPKDIQQAVTPKTKEEKRQSLFWGIPFLIVLIAIPFLSAWQMRNDVSGASSFLSFFLNAFAVGMLFNLVDLLILDYAIVCLWRPRFVQIPGTEGMSAYGDYIHHLRGFMIGTLVSAFTSLLIATFISLIG